MVKPLSRTPSSSRALRPEVEQRGLAAVEIGAALLDVLHKARVPLGVGEIARASGFAPSRVHHYLVSLVKTGLVSKEAMPARYRLGPFAIRLGLTAVDRLEVQHVCAPFLHRVSTDTHEASFFSVWSPAGPVIVRWEQGLRPLTVFARLGTLMPLLRSATGDVYSAWGPPAEVEKALATALLQFAPSQRAEMRRSLGLRVEKARRHGVSATRGAMLPDVSAVAAPIFGANGEMTGAITVLGLLRGFDASPRGTLAHAVRNVSDEFSRKLGFVGLS